MSTPYTKFESPLNEYLLVCRGCLANSGEMKNIYEWGLSDDFFKFTDVEAQRTECISELLCTQCEEALMACKRFRTQCQQSDLQLRRKTEKEISSTPEIINETDDHINASSFKLDEKKLVIMVIAPNTRSKIYLNCPHCSGAYIKKRDLLTHLTKTHQVCDDFSIMVQFYCPFDGCSYNLKSQKGKWFSGRKFLNQHYNKVHRNKIFQCDMCNSSYSTNSDFNRHLKTCNMTYSCRICKTEYSTNEKYLVHLMRKHPDLHEHYKNERKAEKRKSKMESDTKRTKTDSDKFAEYICDSPKRTFATQTLNPENSIKNDVTLSSWPSIPGKSDTYETKTDEISTQTVFEDLLSLKSQTSEDESLFFSETVSLSDIQTQTFPLEFGLSRSNKETITSETQSPDLSIKETQTCLCLYESPKLNFRLFDSVSSSPSSINLTSTETQTAELRTSVKSDVLLSFNSAETQTCFDEELNNDDL